MSRDRIRTSERSGSPADREPATDFDVGIDEVAAGDDQPSGQSGLGGRVASRATSLFAPRRFLLALGLSVVGLFAANAFVPLPGSGLLGVFLATFLFGLRAEERRYAEASAAGAVTVGASFLLDYAVVVFLGSIGPSLALVGAALGAVVGIAGTYFGRDLRHGLTQDIS